MLPLTYTVPALLGQLNQTQKVGDKTIFVDYSKGTPDYTDISGGQKKKTSFAEILGYATSIGGIAVNVLNALKSPPSTSGGGLSLTSLSTAEQAAAADLKAAAEAEQKRKQKQYLIIGGVVLLVIVGATILFKSKK